MQPKRIEHHYHFCPQCGVKNNCPTEGPFRCKPCGFTQFFGPVAAVGALIRNERDELLLVRRARNPGKGRWGLPGGFIDRGESVETAMRREVREETQLEICDACYLTSFPNDYNYHGIVSPVVDLFYTARVIDPATIVLAKDELDLHIWVRPNAEQLEQMAFPSNRFAVEHWLNG
ncbi:MAG: NUDIX domain-containing protein [Rubripirellula sp.]|jgi:ADP-ribose pyrophosphatase|nr:NUDIX domain-containing protein [Planctomycetaceae bacterium]MDF1844175.1 NUDIX domain-containing protein [Rubripirellula sp.]